MGEVVVVDFNDRREIKPRSLSERYPMLFDPTTDSPEEHKPEGASHPGEFRAATYTTSPLVEALRNGAVMHFDEGTRDG